MAEQKNLQTMRTIVNRNALLFPDKTAMKEFETGKACTFLEMKEKASKIGNALYALGLNKGDPVSVLSQNSYEYAELFTSVPSAGFILVPLNFRLALPEIIGVLNDAGSVALFLHDQYIKFAGQIKAAVPTLRHFIYIGPEGGKPDGWIDYDEMLRDASPADIEVEVMEDDPAFLMYTSGTTGLPKGVVQTHLNHYHNARNSALSHKINEWDVGFTICPMYHATAYTSFFAPYYVGASSVLFQKWDTENLFRATQEEGLVAGMLATPMVRMILDDWPKIKGKYNISSLRKIWFAGAGIIPSVYKEFVDTFGCILETHHGTTETTGTTTFLSKEEIAAELAKGNLKILESCGRDGFDMEIQIVDHDDNIVIPPGTGEMRARGLGLTNGYWKNPEKTNEAFRKGWFYTEDVCNIDERGYIYVIDRKKDMIITGGENVYPMEIERVVNEHPAVKESVAIGIPHPLWGEAIAVVVELEKGRETTHEEITAHCKGRIAGYKTPKFVYFVDEMPHNATGKILKDDLKRQFGSLEETRAA